MNRIERYVPKAQLFGARLVLFQDAMARRLGITATELKCFRLIQFEDVSTGADLVRETGLTAASVSVVVDRLCRLGYVVRAQDAEDRRRWRLAAVPGMIATVDALYAEHADAARDALGRYSDHDFDVIMRFLDSFAVILRGSARASASRRTTGTTRTRTRAARPVPRLP